MSHTMLPMRLQVPVQKRNTKWPSEWSTRVLTIDVFTGTVTISRHNHPENVLYHSIEVECAQMWPCFNPRTIRNDYRSLEAMMTIRLLGREVPVPLFVLDGTVMVEASSFSSTPARRTASAGDTPRTPRDFSFTSGDPTMRNRPLRRDAVDGDCEAWMLRFTSLESYEAALKILETLQYPDGTLRRVFGARGIQDLTLVRQAWAARHAPRPIEAAKRTDGGLKEQPETIAAKLK